MTTEREQIIAAAREAGFDVWIESVGPIPFWIERFYAIALEHGRQAEREEIVKDLLPPITTPQTKAHYIANEIAEALCKAIRARGDSK